ncbi:MAG TPA: pyridoxal phosphate-dependent aminotransferase [Vicinamibacteria bacterium]
MFSGRTAWDLTPNHLASLVDEQRRAGRELIDLTETNPTRAGFTAPADVLALLADPAGLHYDPQPAGLPAARQAVAADFARRGTTVAPEDLVLTASSSEAYALLFKLLADPGDQVLVPRPSYPLFDYLARLESVEAVPYALAYDGEWHLPRHAVEAALTERARAVVVVSPNNPTGSFLKRDEAAGLAELCARRGLALIADEVFADYPLRPDPRRAASLAAESAALSFALGGLSKSCGLPQLKLGWIAVGGPGAQRAAALARLEVIADTYLSVNTPVQVAAPRLLARAAELRAPIAERVRANLVHLRAALAGSAGTVLDAEGGWSAVVQVPATRSEEAWAAELLEREGVRVHPGFFFDFPGEAFLVVSLLTPPAAFQEGIARLRAML